MIVTKNKAETDLSALSSQTEQEDKENLGDEEEVIKPQLKSVDEKLEEKENTGKPEEEVKIMGDEGYAEKAKEEF